MAWYDSFNPYNYATDEQRMAALRKLAPENINMGAVASKPTGRLGYGRGGYGDNGTATDNPVSPIVDRNRIQDYGLREILSKLGQRRVSRPKPLGGLANRKPNYVTGSLPAGVY